MSSIKLNDRMKVSHIGLSEESIPVQLCYNDSDIVVILCPPSPHWGGAMFSPPLMERLFFDMSKDDISCMTFTYAKYQIFNDIYSKYITQTSMCVEEAFMEFGNNKLIWLVGLSFGALNALNVFLRRPALAGVVMISPPILHFDFVSWLNVNTGNCLLVYGTKDELIPKTALESYIACLKNYQFNLVTYPVVGADHALTGKEGFVSKQIIRYIKTYSGIPTT